MQTLQRWLQSAVEYAQVNLLIQEAVESANSIDDEVSAELDKLAAAVASTDLDKALNEIQQSASENQLDLMREALPFGEDPQTVAAWWNSLTPEQQAEFERAGAQHRRADVHAGPDQQRSLAAERVSERSSTSCPTASPAASRSA